LRRKQRILIDTDIFVIDLRYRRDARWTQNRSFLELVEKGKFIAYTSIHNLMEIAGILSFNLSPEKTKELFINFPRRYNVHVLFPEGQGESVCYIPHRIVDLIRKKMSFGDALVADIVLQHRDRLDFFVTWNQKHFLSRLPIPAVSPADLLASAGK